MVTSLKRNLAVLQVRMENLSLFFGFPVYNQGFRAEETSGRLGQERENWEQLGWSEEEDRWPQGLAVWAVTQLVKLRGISRTQHSKRSSGAELLWQEQEWTVESACHMLEDLDS